jgi:hypothetical protein
MTAAWCTFQPTATLVPGITAGIFYPTYVVATSTLEDFYTDGMEGDVIARNGNVLTVRGVTLFANSAQVVQYENADSLVTLGPATLVTADGVYNLPNLNYNSVSVGQHITARPVLDECRGRRPARLDRIQLDKHRVGAPAFNRALRSAEFFCGRRIADESAGHQRLAGQQL